MEKSRELLTDAGVEFVTEYHLASLSTMLADGTIHVVPVGFTLVGNVARVIASGGTQKVRNIVERGHATLSQVDGRNWLTLIGKGRVLTDAESVKETVDLYAARYRQPSVNPERVAILIDVSKVLGSAHLRA